MIRRPPRSPLFPTTTLFQTCDKRGEKISGLSVDPADNHEQWAKDIEETQGTAPNYPLIADHDFAVSKAYGMLPPDVEGDPTERTPAQNATLRNVFVVGPDKKIKLDRKSVV